MKQIFGWIRDQQKEIRVRREHRKAIEGLIENSQLTERFIVMSLLSGVVAMAGIILSDTSILIAAMVLAPLLNPLLSLGGGLVLGHWGLVRFSLRAFAAGFGVVILTIFLLTLAFTAIGVPIDMDMTLAKFDLWHTTPVLLVVAFFSGFGAVYSWLKHAVSANFVGVAIAVALIPFVAMYGILLGLMRWDLIWKLSQFFIPNLILIVVGAVLAFLILKLRVSHEEITDGLED